MTNTPEWKQALDRPRLKSLLDLFPSPKPVIGMIHLWPLPGAPGYNGYGVQKIVDNADGRASPEELFHQVRADEARPACHCVRRHVTHSIRDRSSTSLQVSRRSVP